MSVKSFDVLKWSGDVLAVITITGNCTILDLKFALINNGFIKLNTWEFDFIQGDSIFKYNYPLSLESDISYLTITYLNYDKIGLPICGFEVDVLDRYKSYHYENKICYGYTYENYNHFYRNYTVKMIKKIISEINYLEEELDVLYINLYSRSNNFGMPLYNRMTLEDVCFIYGDQPAILRLNEQQLSRCIGRVIVDSANKDCKLSKIMDIHPKIAIINIIDLEHNKTIKICVNNSKIYIVDVKRFLIENKFVPSSKLDSFYLTENDLELKFDQLIAIDSLKTESTYYVSYINRNDLLEDDFILVSCYMHIRHKKGSIHDVEPLTFTIKEYKSCTIGKLKSILREYDNIIQDIVRLWFTFKKNKIYPKDDETILELLKKYKSTKILDFKILLNDYHKSYTEPLDNSILLMYFFFTYKK